MAKKTTGKATRKADVPRRVLDAALELAALQGWRDTTLADVAEAARVPLAEVLAHYPSKAALLTAFVRRVDAQVVAIDDPELAEQPARDRLFDVIMRRFDALAPHKDSVRAIARDTCLDPPAALAAACTLRRSLAWMLEAARIDASGLTGVLRVKGLGAVYLSVLRVWLADDSEDMARTMAALDRRLRQAEGLATLCRMPRPGRARAAAEPG